MSSPINSSPSASLYFPDATAEEVNEKSVGCNTEAKVEVKTAEKLLEDEFSSLLKKYSSVLATAAGCGSRGQEYVNSVWQELQEFTREHPEFADRIPKSNSRVQSNSNEGCSDGVAELACNMDEIAPDCVIQ